MALIWKHALKWHWACLPVWHLATRAWALTNSWGGIQRRIPCQPWCYNGAFPSYTMKYNMISNLEKYKNIAVAMGVNTCGMTTRSRSAGCEEVLQLVKDINLPYRIS